MVIKIRKLYTLRVAISCYLFIYLYIYLFIYLFIFVVNIEVRSRDKIRSQFLLHVGWFR